MTQQNLNLKPSYVFRLSILLLITVLIRKYLTTNVASGRGILLVAKSDERNVGFVYASVAHGFPFDVTKRVGHLNDLYVLPEYRRKGIGRRLLVECTRSMRESNIDAIWTRVLAKNRPAIKLYEGLGFKVRNYGMTLDIGSSRNRE